MDQQKSRLSTFLSGLRNRLHPYGVDVITVKPGFVRSKMTANMKLPYILTTSPNKVADSIYFAYKYKKKYYLFKTNLEIYYGIYKIDSRIDF